MSLRDLLTFITLSDEIITAYTSLLMLSTLLLLERTVLQRIKRLQVFLQLRTAKGKTYAER